MTATGAIDPPLRAPQRPLRRAAGRGQASAAAPGVPAYIRVLFYAFIVSIPFESANIGFDVGTISLSRIVGYVFFLAAVLRPRVAFRRIPAATWWYVGYLLVFIGCSISVYPFFFDRDVIRMASLTQLLILFVVSANLMADVRVRKGFVVALALGTIALAVTQQINLTTAVVDQGYTNVAERYTALNENANTVAAMFAMGLIATVCLAYGIKTNARYLKPLLWIAAVIVAQQLVRTGSRGGLVALIIGLIVFAFTAGKFRVRLRNTIIVAAVVAVAITASMQFAGVRERWRMTIQERSLAHREYIFPAAWQMFREKPLFGWGPEVHIFELGRRLGEGTSEEHNLLLWLLCETGLGGAIPFCAGMWCSVMAAFRARKGDQGSVPLALGAALFLTNMSGTFHNRKLHWLILAYALACGASVVRHRVLNRRRARLRRAAVVRPSLQPQAAALT